MLHRYLLFLLLFASALGGVLLPGCKPREEQLTSSGGLAFSADTVKFDTVFTTIKTVTKRLWVYNRNSKAVSIDLISLDNPSTSPYTLLINGDKQQTATGVLVRGQDSLLVLVQARLPDNGQSTVAKDFVVQQYLHFSTNGQQQQVLLRSFGQNIYLHDGSGGAVRLPCNAVWTNDRPHVLYGNVVVPAGCTLRLKPGTRVYAHAGAALIVQGTLLANTPADFAPGTGAADTVGVKSPNIVRFAGDRSGETQYATAPGQWLGIIFDATSRGNLLRYAVVQNATYGALLLNPTNQSPRPNLTLRNTVVRYISGSNASFAGVATQVSLYQLLQGPGLLGIGAGVLSLSGDVQAENTLFTDCYEFAVLGFGGGVYDLNYCTVANYPATAGVRQSASLTFTNASATTSDTTVRNSPLAVTLRNSIVWGNIDDELRLQHYDDYQASVSIQNSVLKTQLYRAATPTPNKPGLAAPALGNLVNQDPQFLKPFGSGLGDYRLKPASPAYQHGNAYGPANPTNDLLNRQRTAKPSLGAYESVK